MNAKLHAVFEPICYQSPQQIYANFAETPWNILIDSANHEHEAYGTNRYSYILIDPFDHYVYHAGASNDIDPLISLKEKHALFQLESISGLPPFQGGIAGYLSYDLAHLYYPVPVPQYNDLDYPEICMGFYDLVCSFDHLTKQAYIVSSGFPERDESKRLAKAISRLEWFKSELQKQPTPVDGAYRSIPTTEISSNFTQEQYITAVNRVIEYIRAGDIFEANLAQRFSAQLPDKYQHYALYQHLSILNPSPFSAFMNFGTYKIISASPERFIRLHDRKVETRPIKGTRARRSDPLEDAATVAELLTSEKDFSENVMIVDLMRNDLSIVCEDESVIVEQLCGHEIYQTVHHLVSVISGKLKPEEDAFGLLKATFPGGSITGAPKIRAMQIIAEIEPHHRGPYCGSIALIGFDGSMESSIVIRTYVIKDDKITFHAGGAIVIDSNPLDEYEETLTKGRALRMALTTEITQ